MSLSLIRRGLLIPLLILVLSPWCSVRAADDRPNVLWLTTEDLSPVLGCYGDQYAVTPNLDRLAEEGVRYTQAFAMASVCTPARSCLITGVYSSSMGTQHLRGEKPLAKKIHCYTEFLRDAGYYCTNNVKEDYNFTTPKTAWDESSDTAHWRGRKPGQPFFSIFNFMTTHQSRVRFKGDQLKKITDRLSPDQFHDPGKAPLPPYYPDTPLVREDVAQLYDLVTAMDMQAQDLLDQLEEDGVADNTIVFFYADHGTGMPRHKRSLLDSGTRVPFIIRFPKKYQHLAPGKPGSVCDRLVSFVDFPPTMLSLLGLPIPKYMQGRAFLGEQAGPERDYVFAIRDRVDEVFEMSRAIRDHRYEYIRNYMPHRPRLQHSTFSELTQTRQEMRRLAAADQLSGPVADLLAPTKPAEEFYDTQTDPFQIHNLADLPEHQAQMAKMRNALHRWMIRTRDTALIPELEMIDRSEGGSPYDMARTKGKFDVKADLAAAELVGAGPEKLDAMIDGQESTDAAVRFWSATALAAMGKEAAPARDALEQRLNDASLDVRFTAAEAICALGDQSKGLPVLLDGLKNEDPIVRLHAAITLTAIGKDASICLDQIRTAMEKEKASGTYTMYTKWALQYVIQQIEE